MATMKQLRALAKARRALKAQRGGATKKTAKRRQTKPGGSAGAAGRKLKRALFQGLGAVRSTIERWLP